MDILNNIEWYFGDIKTAINRDTRKPLTKNELNTIVFDDSVKENVKFCFPLNNNFSFSETREYPRPLTVEQVLKIVRNFYIEPLKPENIEKAFEENEEWKECVIEQYNGNVNDIINLDVFSVINDCEPDFCGLSFDEKSSEYFVGIGPE